MRKTVKILHSIAAAGLIGGLFSYMVLLVAAPQGTPAAYADLRLSIAAVSDYVLLPSLAIALVSGLISMVVHRPFLDMGWVWVKAVLGILMFKGVLTIIGAKSGYAATVAQRIASGDAPPDALANMLALEWGTLIVVAAIAAANVVIGVWRPRLVWAPASARTERRAAAAAPETRPPEPEPAPFAHIRRETPAKEDLLEKAI